ncbi:MAG: chemotaxis protein CheW [Thiohalomonadales bacterium]
MLSSEPKNGLVLPSEVLKKHFSIPLSESKDKEIGHQTELTSFNSYAFKVGDLGLILESEKVVSEVIDMLPMCTIPNAPGWLYSMANLRGNITPIFNLLDIFGYKSSNNIETRKILIIGTKEEAVGILIDQIPFRVILSSSDKVEMLANLPTLLSPHVRACYEKDNSIWVDWDVYGFFNSLKVNV